MAGRSHPESADRDYQPPTKRTSGKGTLQLSLSRSGFPWSGLS